MKIQDDLQKMSEQLRQQRDEFRVQLHLAKEDVKDEWDDLETQWENSAAKCTRSVKSPRMPAETLLVPLKTWAGKSARATTEFAAGSRPTWHRFAVARE